MNNQKRPGFDFEFKPPIIQQNIAGEERSPDSDALAERTPTYIVGRGVHESTTVIEALVRISRQGALFSVNGWRQDNTGEPMLVIPLTNKEALQGRPDGRIAASGILAEIRQSTDMDSSAIEANLKKPVLTGNEEGSTVRMRLLSPGSGRIINEQFFARTLLPEGASYRKPSKYASLSVAEASAPLSRDVFRSVIKVLGHLHPGCVLEEPGIFYLPPTA